MPKPKVLQEILRDEELGHSSRTRDAILSGRLVFKACPACNGEGAVPND